MKARFFATYAFVMIGSLLSINVFANSQPKIAIVIDDIGYRKTDFSALKLPGQFTYSVVPFAPFTHTIAHSVHESQREVMAHIPMEALHNNHLLGKGALRVNMSEESTREMIRKIIMDIPFVSGINNHMGSHFTTQSTQLSWLMDELLQQDLYFIDSKTTAYSQAEKVAVEHGLRTGHRHVFLDNQLDYSYLDKQFNQLISIARQHNQAIAIAHPHPQSIAFLKIKATQLEELGIQLVPVSQLLPEMTRLARARYLKRSHNNKRLARASAAIPQ